MTFAQRRWLWIALLLAAVVAVNLWLPANTFLSGWLLFALTLALTFFNARKKLPFLPAGSAESWLQFHIYVGFFTAALFFIHISYHWPRGWFNAVLGALYALVMLSGIIGLVWTRSYPKRLTTRGGEVLFERIPGIRRSLQEEAEAMALKSVAEAQSTTIANFYTEHLVDFFSGPQNCWLHLVEVRSPLNDLLTKIGNLNRFLNEQERTVTVRLAELVRQKDGLDYEYALQSTLKGWLFVHIPLTYSLLLFTLAHLVIVYAFSGGAR
jgi:hypothetical protein